MMKKAFKEAADIVRDLPKPLQVAAFNRAVDELLKRNQSHDQGELAESAKTTPGGEWFAAIDRTKHPDIGATTRVADRALKVLELARDTYKVDGLTAAQIATILKDKFRLPVKVNAVNMALQREIENVDERTSSNGKKLFVLMQPGDEYLASLRAGKKEIKAANYPRRAKAAHTGKSHTPHGKKINPNDSKGTSHKIWRGRPGPKQMIDALIEEGFFDHPKAIKDILEHMRKKGYMYRSVDVSPALIRTVRSEKLSRDLNKDGQYAYQKLS